MLSIYLKLILCFICLPVFAMELQHSQSFENLAQLAQDVDLSDLEEYVSEHTSDISSDSSEEKSPLQPYLQETIQPNHWYAKILRQNDRNIKIIKQTLEKYNQICFGKDQSERIQYPLHEAVREGLAAPVNLLVRWHADVNFPNYHGAAPLHYVARVREDDREKALAIAEFLLANHAKINQINNVHETPLCFAVDAGFRRLVRLYLKKGADASGIGGVNGSPLERAAKAYNSKMIVTLLKHAKNIDSSDTRKALDYIERKLSEFKAPEHENVDRRKIKQLKKCLALLRNPEYALQPKALMKKSLKEYSQDL